VRALPMRELADAVGPKTTLVACSHVNWINGETAPAELAQVGVPVVLDGAQGVGAVPIDLQALGCAAYAASGQKWLCGADGTGMLYLAPAFRARVRMIAPGYLSFEDVSRGLDSELRTEAQAWGAPISREAAAFSLGALRVLDSAGFSAVYRRAAELAAELAERLQAAGRRVVPRAATTLVSFGDPDPAETRLRLAEAGVAIRDLPGTPLLRASVGAWNDESDLERLLDALG
jgi:selenocysteine lyase/cysteine desulfurase